jgi:hypothetical protein
MTTAAVDAGSSLKSLTLCRKHRIDSVQNVAQPVAALFRVEVDLSSKVEQCHRDLGAAVRQPVVVVKHPAQSRTVTAKTV